LEAALYRQCRVNVVLELIASRSPDISEVEIGIYYHLHKDQFNRPELREACHILISINPDYPKHPRNCILKDAGNQCKTAKETYKFADMALKHSECPTALQGGVLGLVPRASFIQNWMPYFLV